MQEIIALWMADPLWTLAVFAGVVGLAAGVWRRSGVPAFVGVILGLTLAIGPGVFVRLAEALSR